MIARQLIGNHPIAAESATTNAVADPGARLDLQIRFALRHQAALEQLLAEQQNPTSPNYHRWLKTGEFFQRFGPTKSEVKAVTEWLSERRIRGYGRLGRLSRIYRQRRAGAANFRGEDREIRQRRRLRQHQPIHYIPVRFANVIGAVTGMDNMIHAAPVSQHPNGDFDPDAIISGNQAFGPNDFHTFYDDNPGPGKDGNGDCIAIVGTSDFLDSAMSAFTNQFGLPPISYTRELHGANPGINGAEVEAELDLQWAHAAAPGASIVFHLGGYLVDDITGAVNDNQCGAISISYGFCGPSPAFINGIIHPLFQQAAAQGQSVFVSSGDQGAAGLGYDPATNSCVAGNSPSVNEMSADPECDLGGRHAVHTDVRRRQRSGIHQRERME